MQTQHLNRICLEVNAVVTVTVRAKEMASVYSGIRVKNTGGSRACPSGARAHSHTHTMSNQEQFSFVLTKEKQKIQEELLEFVLEPSPKGSSSSAWSKNARPSTRLA